MEKIKRNDFVLGLISALRVKGVTSFRSIVKNGNINSGLERAIEKLESEGIVLDEPIVSDVIFMLVGIRYVLITGDIHDSDITLLSRESAKEYFRYIFPEKYVASFEKAAENFLGTFKKNYTLV